MYGINKDSKPHKHTNNANYRQLAMQMMAGMGPFVTEPTMPNPLLKWGSTNTTSPSISQIKNIDIYDFDNTLFKTPHPNPELLCTSAIGVLESLNGLQHGGWWADSRFLQGVGKGFKEEKERAWEGWWNEDVVELVRLSMTDPETLTVLLTGRRSSQFRTLITQIVESKELEFDAILLRPDNVRKEDSTLQFKSKVISDIIAYYSEATRLSIYEDRPKQTAGFRKLLKRLSEQRRSSSNTLLLYEVVEVYEPIKYMDPLVERQLIESVINAHNEALVKNQLSKSCRYGRVELVQDIQHTGFMLDKPSTVTALKQLHKCTPEPGTTNAFKYEGTVILSKEKPVGAKIDWRITHVGHLDGRIWAARVEPVDDQLPHETIHNVPLIILALRRKTNPTEVENISNWVPLDDQPVISTRLGSKALLKLNARKR